MHIAVASGKGGTGKTTVAVALALSLEAEDTLLLDCDVEAPNAHLFLKPVFEEREDVGILTPRFDGVLCTACGRCSEVCRYNALARLGDAPPLLFPELCHGCGSCFVNCPEKAVTEVLRGTGVLEAGPTPFGPAFARGKLNVGEPMAVPVIRRLKQWGADRWGGSKRDWILDAPPGTSCPVVETLRGADFVLLVTEPTPFGLHDLKLIAEVLTLMKLPAGVVINRDGMGDDRVERFCEDRGLPVMMRIPFSRAIGGAIARGEPLTAFMPEYRERFIDLRAALETAPAGKEGRP